MTNTATVRTELEKSKGARVSFMHHVQEKGAMVIHELPIRTRVFFRGCEFVDAYGEYPSETLVAKLGLALHLIPEEGAN